MPATRAGKTSGGGKKTTGKGGKKSPPILKKTPAKSRVAVVTPATLNEEGALAIQHVVNCVDEDCEQGRSVPVKVADPKLPSAEECQSMNSLIHHKS